MIKINEKEVKIPETWNDLSIKQAIACYAVIMHPFSALLPAGEEMIFKRIELMKIILDIEKDFLDFWKADCIKFYEEDGELIFQREVQETALNATAALFSKIDTEDQLGKYQLNLSLTKCPWPVLDNPDGDQYNYKFYGPADGLANLTIYELGMAFMSFERFMLEEKDTFADELIAILYRPAKPATEENLRSDYQGDIRLPYLHHESTVPKRQKIMAQLPEAVKQLILFWFASCRDQIIKGFENIFSTPKKDSLGGNDYAWAGLILELSDGIYNIDKVAAQPWSTALTYISMLEDRRKQQELDAAFRKARAKSQPVL